VLSRRDKNGLFVPLIDAKKIRVTHLKTDTHWNRFGGFVAYRAMAEALLYS
jgi:hypothetical protein